MSNNVTDRILLKEIYTTYHSDFCAYEKGAPTRDSKMYVPIDCTKIAEKLNLDPDIVFGRLYYHLEKKHDYKQSDGANVHLFAFKAGNDRHAVNFPLLSAVSAELEQSYYRFTIPLFVSALALIISIAAYVSTNT